MTDNEIIKALECCKNADCLNCPRWSEEWYSGMCNDFLSDVLDLINRQKAKIERLKAKCENTQVGYNFARDEIEQWKEEANRYQNLWCEAEKDLQIVKSEARKEFAEKVKQEKIYSLERHEYIIPVSVMDWTLQKMESES